MHRTRSLIVDKSDESGLQILVLYFLFDAIFSIRTFHFVGQNSKSS